MLLTLRGMHVRPRASNTLLIFKNINITAKKLLAKYFV